MTTEAKPKSKYDSEGLYEVILEIEGQKDLRTIQCYRVWVQTDRLGLQMSSFSKGRKNWWRWYQHSKIISYEVREVESFT